MTAIRVTSNGIKSTLADGTIRIQIEVEPKDARLAFEMMGVPGTQLAVAALTLEATQAEAQKEMIRQYGEEARQLKLSGFFRSPHVWKAIGLPSDYPIAEAEQESWDHLKDHLGYESWSEVPPAVLSKWAHENGVERYLPAAYK